MTKPIHIELEGKSVSAQPGETILDVARREGLSIPTLCHDPRLEPAGACRTCLVQIEGWRRLAPACATKVADGMKIEAENERIDRHRTSLMSLYMADHPRDPERAERGAPNELLAMATAYGADLTWAPLEAKRGDRTADENPYILYDAETCIMCARCTRYCDEIESVSAITLAGRGSETTISTAEGKSLLDTTCEMCGGCIDVCPTGAMGEKQPLVRGDKPEKELTQVRSTCNFCGVGCQVDLNVDPAANGGKGRVVKVTSPPVGVTSNDGNLCVKGRFAYDFVDHGDRLTEPLARNDQGQLVPVSWDEALARVAAGLQGVSDRHGPDALAFVSSSRCTMEENFAMQKLSRAVYRTNNVHQCAAT